MGGRCRQKERSGEGDEVPPGDEAAEGLAEPHTPGGVMAEQDVGGRRKGSRCSLYGGEKVYLGVRVKMPVRDLLRKIRTAKGWEGKDFQDIYSKTVKGNKQRVKTRTGRRTTKRNLSTKSLEELAIIVEVLEEDLRTGGTCPSPPQSLSSPRPPVSPDTSPPGSEYNSDECDEMMPSPPESDLSCTAEYQLALSPPPGFLQAGLQACGMGDMGTAGWDWTDPHSPDWNLNSSAFFWAQLHKEENELRDVSDSALLAGDQHGRTALHKVACVGKRAMGYAIAKRMALLNTLDVKDVDGMTALLYAAKHNHHLMVADLIHLGANVNAMNNLGKTCLHLSAEKGYVRVLEVLKLVMMDGVYVDVEAIDHTGMSVLQCASVALQATVRKLESSKLPSHTRLHTLRQEQMMETLECLLQMCSYFHTMGSRQSLQPKTG